MPFQCSLFKPLYFRQIIPKTPTASGSYNPRVSTSNRTSKSLSSSYFYLFSDTSLSSSPALPPSVPMTMSSSTTATVPPRDSWVASPARLCPPWSLLPPAPCSSSSTPTQTMHLMASQQPTLPTPVPITAGLVSVHFKDKFLNCLQCTMYLR